MPAVGATTAVATAYAGAYNAATAYTAGQIVTYQGSTWLATAAATGVTPANGATWALLAVKGDPGLGGSGTCTTVTSAYSASAGDVVLANAASGSLSVTLPASPVTDAVVVVKKTDSGANAVNVLAAALIDGTGTQQLTLQYQTMAVQYTGTTWVIKAVGRKDPGVVPAGGAIGQVLTKSAAAAYSLTWAAPTGLNAAVLKGASYTAVSGDNIQMDATSQNRSVTLPASPNDGDLVAVHKLDNTGNQVIVSSGATIDGYTSYVLSRPGQSALFMWAAATGRWWTRGSGRTPLYNYRLITTTGNALSPGDLVFANATSGALQVLLPATSATSREGDLICVKKTDTTVNAVTIAGNGATIDGSPSNLVLTGYQQSVTLQYTWATGNWIVVATSGTPANGVIAVKTAAYGAQPGEFVLADATTGYYNVTLPATPGVGATVTVKKTDTSNRAVIVAAPTNILIDGGLTHALDVQNASATFVYDGTNWQVSATSALTLPSLQAATYTAGLYYDRRSFSAAPNQGLTQAGAYGLGTSSIVYISWFSFRQLAIDQIAFGSGGASPPSGMQIRFGIYSSQYGQPGALLYDLGLMSVATTTNTFNYLTGITAVLPKGWCWIALSYNQFAGGSYTGLPSGATLPSPGPVGLPTAQMNLPSNAGYGQTPAHYAQTGTAGATALPGQAGGTAQYPQSATTALNVWLRAA